jgi:hypothetical protein
VSRMGDAYILSQREPLTDAYLLECEQAARRFSGAYTGTSGSLAAMVLHLLGEVQRLKAEWQLLAVAAAMKENEPPVSY